MSIDDMKEERLPRGTNGLNGSRKRQGRRERGHICSKYHIHMTEMIK